jgi:hypothetical protein
MGFEVRIPELVRREVVIQRREANERAGKRRRAMDDDFMAI